MTSPAEHRCDIVILGQPGDRDIGVHQMGRVLVNGVPVHLPSDTTIVVEASPGAVTKVTLSLFATSVAFAPEAASLARRGDDTVAGAIDGWCDVEVQPGWSCILKAGHDGPHGRSAGALAESCVA